MVYECVAGCDGEQSSSVCGADRSWELKDAFISHQSLGNLSQTENTEQSAPRINSINNIISNYGVNEDIYSYALSRTGCVIHMNVLQNYRPQQLTCKNQTR